MARQGISFADSSATVGLFSVVVEGHLIEGESQRFMAIDRQRNHFLCVIRAWRPDGSSQLLFASRLLEWRQINELYSKYKFNKPARVLIDAGFDTSAVYAFCAAHGFAAVMGEGRVEISMSFGAIDNATRSVIIGAQVLLA